MTTNKEKQGKSMCPARVERAPTSSIEPTWVTPIQVEVVGLTCFAHLWPCVNFLLTDYILPLQSPHHSLLHEMRQHDMKGKRRECLGCVVRGVGERWWSVGSSCKILFVLVWQWDGIFPSPIMKGLR
jgi:hypothetical protein